MNHFKSTRKYTTTACLLVAALLLCAPALRAQSQSSSAAKKLQFGEFIIANFYVDDVNEDKLVEEAIVRMLAKLDPHSTYLTPDEVKRMNEPLQGNFEGIGVQFNMIEDTLFVTQPVSNGPSERVGILPGDRIVAVNDTAIAGVKMSTEEIMRRLRGPKGTKVVLTVVRRGAATPHVFTVTRDKIPILSLDAAYMIKPRTGYIRVNRFSITTAKEFSKALNDLQKEGMKDLILDLQGNGGGYLTAAVELSNEFLDQKNLVVYTEGRSSARTEYAAKGDGKFKKGRLVVLVDEYSASASEILGGAIQDWDRGLIVGRRTFGKGLVQRPFDLPDGSMMRLTVARYHTPSGRYIQKPYESENETGTTGQSEDNRERYNRDLMERYNRGEMNTADSIHFPDSLAYTTLKLKRTVYGGGGIMPDYFVPLDTTRYTNYHRKLAANGLILKTTMKYTENHRADLRNKYTNFDTFNNRFEVTDDILARLRAAADEVPIEFDEEQYTTSLPLIKTQLKALIARDLWDINEYFCVMNSADETVQKALELLSNGGYEEVLGEKGKEK